MYTETEIREFVNFFARIFHLRVPKRKVGMFCEHLANNCIFRFQPYWNIKQPKQYEEQRVIRIAIADEVITSAATAVGLELEELGNYLPESLNLHVNPGHFFYTTGDCSQHITIWIGSVNEDDNYKPALFPPLRPPSLLLLPTILPQMPAPIQPLLSAAFMASK